MAKYFVASLLRDGILGGGITADDESYTYRTNKVTVSPALKNIRMRYADIREVSEGLFLCFPAVTVDMKDGSSYRFIVFRRDLFRSCMSDR